MAIFSSYTYKDKIYSLLQSVGGDHIIFVFPLYSIDGAQGLTRVVEKHLIEDREMK